MGEDTKFATPPSRIELLPQRGTQGFEKNGFVLRAVPTRKGAIVGRAGPAYWTAESENRIDLVWTDGFTGVSITLQKHGKELRGWAHPHFDHPGLVPHVARVTARSIPCGTPDARLAAH
jgi:hypothetical protein